MTKINKLLIIILLSSLVTIEGWAFLSKPKINVNKNILFKEELSNTVTSVSQNNSLPEKENIPVQDNQGDLNQEIKEQICKLELLGTALGNVKDPIAFIKDLESGQQGIYRMGSKIREAKIIKIVMGEVTLEINGHKETLKLSGRGRAWAMMNTDNPAILSKNAEEIVLSKSGLFNEKDKIVHTMRSIKIKPYYEEQKVAGMMVDGIPENSIIAAVGIQNKDIVKTVNNQKVNSYQKALQIFSKAKNQSEIKVGLLRDGQAMSLSYRIAK